jgi:hypothetical protein
MLLVALVVTCLFPVVHTCTSNYTFTAGYYNNFVPVEPWCDEVFLTLEYVSRVVTIVKCPQTLTVKNLNLASGTAMSDSDIYLSTCENSLCDNPILVYDFLTHTPYIQCYRIDNYKYTSIGCPPLLDGIMVLSFPKDTNYCLIRTETRYVSWQVSWVSYELTSCTEGKSVLFSIVMFCLFKAPSPLHI